MNEKAERILGFVLYGVAFIVVWPMIVADWNFQWQLLAQYPINFVAGFVLALIGAVLVIKTQ